MKSMEDKSDLVKAIEKLDIHDHLCLIYETREEQFASIIPFMRIGLERGEKCIYIVDDNTADAVLTAMHSEGINVQSAIKSGALVIATKQDAYLKNGYFDPDWMIYFLKETTDATKAAGFKALRVTGEMTWALGNDHGVDRLIEYESKLNYFFPHSDVLAICQYNRNRFKPDIILEVIHTHPIVIYGDMVCENLYYIPPDEFLKPNQTSLQVERQLHNIIERKQAEEELKKSEEKYRLLADNVTDAIWTMDMNLHFTYVSPSFERLLGYGVEEAKALGLSELLSHASLEVAMKAFKDELIIEKTEQKDLLRSRTLDLELKRKDGSTLWSEIKMTFLRDQDTRPIGILGVSREITERKRAENMLKLNESRLEALLELNKMTGASLQKIANFTLEEAIRLTESEIGYLAFTNEDETVLTMYAWSKKAMDECLISDKPLVYPVETTGLWGEAVRQRKAIITNDYSAPNPLKRGYPEGHVHVIRHMNVPIFDGDHIVVVAGVGNKASDYDESDVNQLTLLMQGMWRIIQRKEAEEKLQKSKASLAEAQRIAHLGNWNWNVQNNELYWSDEIYRIFGLVPQEFGTNYEAFLNSVHPDDRELVKKAVNEALFERKPYSIDHRIILPNGLERIVYEQAEVTFDESGKPVHMIGTVQDITERKQSEEQIQRQLQRLAALHNIDVAITASLDLRITLRVILDEVISQLGVDAADILLLNPHIQTLEYAAERGFRTSALQHTCLRIGEGHAGRAALERITVSIPNLSESENGFTRSRQLKNEDFVTYHAMPLITKGQVKGVLEVFHRTPFDPDLEWLEFLEALSTQAAIAIENATLFNDLQRSNIELSLAYDATIEGWSRALDYRDKETEGHSQRVTDYTLKIAHVMGIREEELIHVRRGALLHDIGKLGVPDAILFKPGKLTDEEWVVMKRHPVIAYELLSPIPYLKRAIDIPYCHHEKWDGTGYPRGLKGEDIPLSSRIFAVVDVWDALNSDRPYRPAWPIEKTRKYIREEAGNHFDPKVVEAFLKVIVKM